MRIEKCNFCSANVYPGKGTIFIRNDARKFRFCRKKCRLAFMKKKNPTRTKWTKASRISKQKELSTQINEVFEKRRIIMNKYDKEAMEMTLQALPEVLKMVQKKKDHHIMKRLAIGTEDRKARDLNYVNNKMHLIRAPHAKGSEDENETEEDSEVEDMVDIGSEEEREEEMDVEENLDVGNIIFQNTERAAPVKSKAKVVIQEIN